VSESYDVPKPRCLLCGREAVNWVVWDGQTVIGCQCVADAGYSMVMLSLPPVVLSHPPRNGVVLIK